MGLCNTSLASANLHSRSNSDTQFTTIMNELRLQNAQIEYLASKTIPIKKRGNSISIYPLPQGPKHRHSNSQSHFSFLLAENQELQQAIRKFESWQYRTLLKILIRNLNNFHSLNLQQCFDIWKIPSTLITTLSYDEDSLVFYESLNNSNNRQLLAENVLLDNSTQAEKPMNCANIFKLFDDLLDKKFEADTIDSEQLKFNLKCFIDI